MKANLGVRRFFAAQKRLYGIAQKAPRHQRGNGTLLNFVLCLRIKIGLKKPAVKKLAIHPLTGILSGLHWSLAFLF
ncbi:MAG: hypothetical protein RR825_00280 [Ruthenibacterium sp.]